MIVRQLFDQVSSTYTSPRADAQTREAVLIDGLRAAHARRGADPRTRPEALSNQSVFQRNCTA
jgi:hypothetical protein